MTRITRRTFLEHSLLGTAAASLTPGLAWSASGRRAGPNDVLRVGVIGVRGRGRAHIGGFNSSPDSEVVAICDPDEGIIGPAMKSAVKAVPDAKYYRDLREMLDDPSIDVVTIATPNHWHSLATIWALQAGKHVYVEKPLSHNVFEGRQVVEAQKKYGKIVQVGTQSRSAQATIDSIEWLRAGGLGKVLVARGLCYKRRQTIGKVDGPQQPPATLDYELWTGPAAMEPLMRKNLHYDWHWVFNTGNGDMGNQGVHQMDIARWGLGKDTLPEKIISCGGRFGYIDDGNTPNSQVALYDYGDQKLVFETRGLETPGYHGSSITAMFHCENGHMVNAGYNRVVVYDNTWKEVKTFTGGGNHYQTFLDAVKANDQSQVKASPIDGHLSAALCHLGNISYQVGSQRPMNEVAVPFGVSDHVGNETYLGLCEHLEANGVDPEKTEMGVGPELSFDPEKERFQGAFADEANALLTRAERAPFVVPTKV